MKKLLLLLAVCALGLAATPVYAKGKKNKDASTDVFARFDTNGNGVLDDSEKDAIRKAFAAGDPDLKKYDANNDGKLDDNEIAAIQPAPKKHKKKKNA